MPATRLLVALGICAAAVLPAYSQSIHYSYTVRTAAGSDPTGDGGPAKSAVIEPLGVYPATGGGYYIGERNGRVRRVAPDGTITTIAELSGNVYAVTEDGAGNVYAASTRMAIYRIPPGGKAELFAGGGNSTDDGIPAKSASLVALSMAFDPDGRLVFADYFYNRVRAIDKNGIVSTLAGNGSAQSSGDGGPALQAGLRNPMGVAFDKSGNLYIAELGRIRKVGADGIIQTIAGTGQLGVTRLDGSAARLSACIPSFMAIADDGTIYFSETGAAAIHRIDPDGSLVLVAGTYEPNFGGDGLVGPAALLDTPYGVALDSAGDLLIADYGNARIRKVTKSTRIINTVAGSGHYAGDGGAATNALLWQPSQSAYDNSGNLYVNDYMNKRMRRVNSAGVIASVAGNGKVIPNLENVEGTQMAIGFPSYAAADPQGNLIFGEFGAVRKYDPSSGKVATFAGEVSQFGNSGDGGPARAARFNVISGLAWDNQGSLYVADQANNRIRKISTDNTVSAFAGSGSAVAEGDGGRARDAGIPSPGPIAFDSQGSFYVLSAGNQVRKIAPDGTISTVLRAGNGATLDLVPRPADKASIPYMTSLTIDSSDTLYFSFQGGIGALKGGLVWLVAGQLTDTGFGGDEGIALAASFGSQIGLSARGRVLVVTDTDNHRVRVLTPLDPTRLEIAGGNTQTGTVGTAFANELVVSVRGGNGLPAALVPVDFAVTSGRGSLSTTSLFTDAGGMARTRLTPGDAGTVKVSATVAGLASVEFVETAVSSQPLGDPSIADGGITGAALSVPPVRAVSPNAIVTVWGSNFIPSGTQRRLGKDDLVNGRIPTQLGGICVDFGGARAPIFDVYPGQLNIQVPAVSGAKTTVRVLRNCGETNETASNPMEVNVAPMTPEFFAFSSRADGHVPVAARLYPTNRIVGPPGAYGEASEPAKPGSIVTIYGTGFGLTEPGYAAGELPAAAASPAAAPTVTLGGVTLSTADVQYVGVTPGSAGLYQLNIRIPDAVPDGEQPIVLKLGNTSTPSGPYLLIAR